jgi:hypothetical protein
MERINSNVFGLQGCLSGSPGESSLTEAEALLGRSLIPLEPLRTFLQRSTADSGQYRSTRS